MSKYAILNLPAHGHINPTLAISKELVDRGHTVVYYSFEEFKEKIVSTGAKYKDTNIDISNINIDKLTNIFTLLGTLLEVTDDILLDLIKDLKIENPDCIIHDSLCPFGKFVGEKLNIPTVNSITTFAINDRLSKDLLKSQNIALEFINNLPSIYKINKYKNRLKKKKLVIENVQDLLLNEEALNIVYTSKEFQPYGDTFDNKYVFVGPSISNRNDILNDLSIVNRNKPVLYISLGTIVNKNLQFYKQCIDALKDFDGTIIMSIGRNTNIKNLGPIPSNFIVKNHVPQLDVLSISSLFITHGGMNSVHEGLYYKVPLIVYPQQKEQEMVAARVEECELGLYLKNYDSDSLKKAVYSILNNSYIKENVKYISKTLIESGGYVKAADKIEDYTKKNL